MKKTSIALAAMASLTALGAALTAQAADDLGVTKTSQVMAGVNLNW